MDDTPITQDTTADGMSAVRRSLERREISQSAINIVISSWRESTQSQYKCYIRDGTLSVMNGIKIPITQMS